MDRYHALQYLGRALLKLKVQYCRPSNAVHCYSHNPEIGFPQCTVTTGAADLLHEEVADVLQQTDETWRRAEVPAVGPHQAHSVHQGADLTSDLRKLYVLHVFEQMLEWLQVDADVPRLFQSWK